MLRVCVKEDIDALPATKMTKSSVRFIPSDFGGGSKESPFGQLPICDGCAILNNLFLNTGITAINVGSQAAQTGPLCSPGTRNTIVARNIVFGQRTDPTNVFLAAFALPERFQNSPLPTLTIPFDNDGRFDTVDFYSDFQGQALVNVNVAGTYEGTANNRFFDNVIGRGVSNSVGMKANQWLGNPSPLAKEGVVTLLKKNAKYVFDILANPPGRNAKGEPIVLLTPGFPALPWWAKKPASQNVKDPMNITNDQPFATDWAVQLPNPFLYLGKSSKNVFANVNYRWVSVRELNAPHLGDGNTSALGLEMVELNVTFPIDTGLDTITVNPTNPTVKPIVKPKVTLKVNLPQPKLVPAPDVSNSSQPWWPIGWQRGQPAIPNAKLNSPSCPALTAALDEPKFSHVKTYLHSAKNFIGAPVTEPCAIGPLPGAK